MDVTVQRTESDRSQNQNGGPRVSFNRDVHVKRIGQCFHTFLDNLHCDTTYLINPPDTRLALKRLIVHNEDSLTKQQQIVVLIKNPITIQE